MKEERYDIVIVGGGPNGTAAAAYLAKSGLSVCILEERPEAGGGCENTEVIPGVRIDPHTTYMYAGAAPGFDQLELWKYGFRMDWRQMVIPEGEAARSAVGGLLTTEGRVPGTQQDTLGFAKLTGMLGDPPFARDLLRSVFWCPPHPPEVEVTADNVPFMQVYKQHAPDVWSEELLEMTMFDLMDEYMETESPKVSYAMIAWYSGAAPHWEGVAIPSLGSALLLTYAGVNPPRGGMHAYFHSIIRCAMAHGVVIRTCCPVDEIIIREGRAVGVRLRDTAACAEKTIWADKAVISGVDVRQTFLQLIGPRYLDTSFMQRVRDINLKGGSLYVSHFLHKGLPRFNSKFAIEGSNMGPGRSVYPCDSRELYYEHIMDLDGRKSSPGVPAETVLWIDCGSKIDISDACTIPGHYLVSPFYVSVPPPEYLAGGPDAIDREKAKWDAYMLKAYGQVVETDNVVRMWSNTPWESEHRNAGLIGGNWCGTRHCRDQMGENRPNSLLPELSRYRTPIDGLYLCNQTSCHPGGLALMAIPYNLMHILIEDGLAKPGDWWYPSPWYIPQEGKISAKLR